MIASLHPRKVRSIIRSSSSPSYLRCNDAVGKSGFVIGVDMTEEVFFLTSIHLVPILLGSDAVLMNMQMIRLAMKNAAKMGSKANNVDFRKGEIEVRIRYNSLVRRDSERLGSTLCRIFLSMTTRQTASCPTACSILWYALLHHSPLPIAANSPAAWCSRTRRRPSPRSIAS